MEKKLGENKKRSINHFPLCQHWETWITDINYAQKWQHRNQRKVIVTEYESQVVSWWSTDGGIVMSFKCSETP